MDEMIMLNKLHQKLVITGEIINHTVLSNQCNELELTRVWLISADAISTKLASFSIENSK